MTAVNLLKKVVEMEQREAERKAAEAELKKRGITDAPCDLCRGTGFSQRGVSERRSCPECYGSGIAWFKGGKKLAITQHGWILNL